MLHNIESTVLTVEPFFERIGVIDIHRSGNKGGCNSEGRPVVNLDPYLLSTADTDYWLKLQKKNLRYHHLHLRRFLRGRIYIGKRKATLSVRPLDVCLSRIFLTPVRL